MPTITYVLKDGNEKTVAAANGKTLMEVAIANNVRGIDAECGGCCSCATCHVYVDTAWLGKLAPPDDMEDELLEGVAADRTHASRLSCQIVISDALDGLVVRVPVTQG
ncbi:2Fe-2S iron-sulfur cluster binding domain-containing protein (plasmid) [Cupriavidus pinatubonensis]|uniref:2Fe-2S iron-sulfur cluster-binding protein n=1 Tax=Cupriavidus pinatubonensis TaxID=248026 RepID=UPI00112AFAF1|nr:2Fe-2S iron-sulfur cluster-binding protein [Cupriavidus pinatubonensis]QYY34019.1 2Fe-2S iron-sulfur cluster binding domain-containing protein [Cupriavidus pinatubonensis]TPQ30164.1 ferredoxin [Cupriavidus pinatubonensis]